MHGVIFQVSKTPIAECDYISELSGFDDHIMDYCSEDIDFDDAFGIFVNIFPDGVFEIGDNTLTLVNIKPLLDMWQDIIDRAYYALKSNVTSGMRRWGMEESVKAPLGGYLFYIKDWNDCTETSDSFIEWVANNFVPGEKIYFGACLDYHK